MVSAITHQFYSLSTKERLNYAGVFVIAFALEHLAHKYLYNCKYLAIRFTGINQEKRAIKVKVMGFCKNLHLLMAFYLCSKYFPMSARVVSLIGVVSISYSHLFARTLANQKIHRIAYITGEILSLSATVINIIAMTLLISLYNRPIAFVTSCFLAYREIKHAQCNLKYIAHLRGDQV